MAKYRHVHTTFWTDAKVLEEMTPEDKYFYLYLITNPNTTQVGVYQITKKQMSFDLGYSMETVNSLVERFENHHNLIKYNPETREIALVKWGKYNLNKTGKPVLDCITREMEEVKDKSLLQLVSLNIDNSRILDMFSRHVDDTYHDTLTTRTTAGGQKEKEKEKENIYAEFVSMKPNEHQKLVEQYGEDLTKKMINTLDNYKGAKGKKYKSDYRAILSWVRDKVLKENNTQQDKKVLTNDDFLF